MPSFHLETTPVSHQRTPEAYVKQKPTMTGRPTTTSTAQTPTSTRGPRVARNHAGRGRAQRRADVSNYADRLIEQLLAAQANSPLTDSSDTSPPSAEDPTRGRLPPVGEQIGLSGLTQQPQRYLEKNNNNNNLVDKDKVFMRPIQLTFPSSPAQPENASTTSRPPLVPDARLSPAPIVVYEAPRAVVPANTNVQQAINTTSGSTPELPTSESSDSLDIQFVDMFDQIEQRDPVTGELLVDVSQLLKDITPALPPSTCSNFPVTYSHSYARELQRVESECQDSNRPSSSSDVAAQHCLSPTRPTTPEPVTPSGTSCARTCLGSRESSPCHFKFSEPLVVSLPPLSHSRKFNKSDLNIDKNYKPHLGNKTTNIYPEADAVCPPIPPRRPVTDTKVGTFSVASSSVQVASLWVSNDSTCKDSSLKSASMSAQSPDVNGSWSCCDPSITMSTGRAYLSHKNCNTAWDRYAGQRSVAKDEPQGNQESTLDSASKRRKANDKSAMPICSSEIPVGENTPVKSARQRLFLSPATQASPESNTPRMRRKKRQSPAMRRLSQQKENNSLSVSLDNNRQARQPLTDLYNIKLNESDALTTSSNSLTHSSEAPAKSTDTSPDAPLISREEDILDRDNYYCDFTVDRQHKIDAMSANKLQPFRQYQPPKESPSSVSLNEKRYTLTDPTTNEVLVRQVEGAESSPSSQVFKAPVVPLRTRQMNQSLGSKHNDSSHINHKARTLSDSTKSSNSSGPRDTRSLTRQSPSFSLISHDQSTFSSTTSSRNASPPRTRSSSSRSRRYSNVQQENRDPRARSSSSHHSRSSARKTCTSHPIASSTLIMEPEETSPETEVESESVYTWSIDEDASSSNLEKSYLRSTSAKKKLKFYNNGLTPRPPTSVGRDSPKPSFDLTAMVSRLDAVLHGRDTLSDTDDNLNTSRLGLRREISCGKQILAAAPSMVQSMDFSRIAHGAAHDSEVCSIQSSNLLSSQATTSSIFLNRARASIQCSSNEGSRVSNTNRLSPNEAQGLSRQISSSEPNMYLHETHSKTSLKSNEPHVSRSSSNTDSNGSRVSTGSERLEARPVVPGKSSPSESSGCTAARCRPRPWKKPTIDIEVTSINSPEAITEGETSNVPHPNQDLLDSILTDSPKSVDSSGIFAPYNSYNSPVESVGSHNGYSSTVSSNITSSDTNYNTSRRSLYRSRTSGCAAPPPTPPHTRNSNKDIINPVPSAAFNNTSSSTYIGRAQSELSKAVDEVEFKRPFTPAPPVNPANRPMTRNQGCTAETASASSSPLPVSTPRRTTESVRSDPLANQSVFAVPPGVVTGPPKIKDKKSLVRKFKKFSSHFYKKEKIQTLANL